MNERLSRDHDRARNRRAAALAAARRPRTLSSRTTIELLAQLPDLRTADEDRSLPTCSADASMTRIGKIRTPLPRADRRVLDYRYLAQHDRSCCIARATAPSGSAGARRCPKARRRSSPTCRCSPPSPRRAMRSPRRDPTRPRFVLLDDAFAKVSEDNHAKLFGLLVELDLDFIATSERLWGTHATVPELAITEVIRDADLGSSSSSTRIGSAPRAASVSAPDNDADRGGATDGRGDPSGRCAGAAAPICSATSARWSGQEYRAIMGVFADTFFSEFTPDDVAGRLADAGYGARCRASSATGSKRCAAGATSVFRRRSAIRQSLADYYRRRNRYLITRCRAGGAQIVEGVLARVDEVRDVSAGRLRALLEALGSPCGARRATRAIRSRLADLRASRVRPARGVHRRDHAVLRSDQPVAEPLRPRRPTSSDSSPRCWSATSAIGWTRSSVPPARSVHRLADLRGRFRTFVERGNKGLAGRVDAAGLSGSDRGAASRGIAFSGLGASGLMVRRARRDGRRELTG